MLNLMQKSWVFKKKSEEFCKEIYVISHKLHYPLGKEHEK